MPKPPQEIELKFAAPAGRGAEAAIEAVANAEPRRLSSVYFDTPRGALKRAGYALRVRREGGVFIQTLKDAGDGAFTRGEWETRVKAQKPERRALAGTPAARILTKTSRLAPAFA